jgi:hypothetical protein
VRIPGEIVGQLIMLGYRSSGPVDEADLAPFRGQDWINRTGPDLWTAATRQLATADVVAVIKGLVVLEQGLAWMGGSVAGAIWVFHVLEGRDAIAAREVADWVLARTSNPYVPFGCDNRGAKSLAELAELDGEYAARQQARREHHLTAQAALAADATHHRAERALHAERHSTAAHVRAEIIERLAALSLPSRLDAIFSDPIRPIDFYPESWTALSPEEIASLPDALRDQMLARLSDRRRGPWRALYLALRRAEGTHPKRLTNG